MPYVWVIAGFLGIYQGSETIAQGYIVTYLLRERVSILNFRHQFSLRRKGMNDMYDAYAPIECKPKHRRLRC